MELTINIAQYYKYNVVNTICVYDFTKSIFCLIFKKHFYFPIWNSFEPCRLFNFGRVQFMLMNEGTVPHIKVLLFQLLTADCTTFHICGNKTNLIEVRQ